MFLESLRARRIVCEFHMLQGMLDWMGRVGGRQTDSSGDKFDTVKVFYLTAGARGRRGTDRADGNVDVAAKRTLGDK